MKMKDVGRFFKAITEQANDPNAPDPFEPIPYTTSTDPIEMEIAALSAELVHTEAKLYSLSTKADIVRSQAQDSPAFSSNRNTNNATSYFSGKNPTLQPGQVKMGTYIFDLSKFPPRVATWIERYGPIYDKLDSRKGTLTRKIKSLQKEQKAQQVTAAIQQGVTAPIGQPHAASTIPVGQIPKKLQTSPGSAYIDNPYFKSGEFAGPAARYWFSTPMRNIYVLLVDTLKRNGLTFGPLYVGRHGGTGGPINFVMATPGDKFVWRKYDAGGASGQNWVYLNGLKMKTSSFVGMTDAQRDAALKVNNVV